MFSDIRDAARYIFRPNVSESKDSVLTRAVKAGWRAGINAGRRKVGYMKQAWMGDRAVNGGAEARRYKRGSTVASTFSTKMKKFRSAGNAVSYQHDVVNMYKRRRPSRRSIRRMKRRGAIVNSVNLRQQPNVVIKRFSNGAATSSGGAQSIFYIPGLFSANGTSGTWDDLNVILPKLVTRQNFVNTASTPFTGSLESAGSFYFGKCIMEFDVTNTLDSPCVLEIFECVSRRNDALGGVAEPSVLASFGSSVPSGMISLGNLATEYTSPFEVRPFVKAFKILSQKRIYLQGHQASDVVLHAKGGKMNGQTIQRTTANQQFNYPGKTRFWLLICTGAPASNGSGGAQLGDTSLLWTAQRTYNIKYLAPSVTNVQGQI